MEINYVYDHNLAARLPDLTYTDLRDMLPGVSRNALPRLKVLLPDFRDTPFLSATQEDISIAVYRNGVYLYEEHGAETMYSVSLAGKLMNRDYASAGDLDQTGERLLLSHCQWYWPLMIAGQTRLFANSGKRQYKIRNRLEKRAELYPDEWIAPDCAEIVHERMEERKLREALEAAWNTLPPREMEILYLTVVRNMTQTRAGEELRITQSSVSITAGRGIARLRRTMTEPTT